VNDHAASKALDKREFQRGKALLIRHTADVHDSISTGNPGDRPGWFLDHETPGRERWWTGTEWSAATHTAAKDTGLLRPQQARLFWPGLNSAARVAEGVSYAAALAMLIVLFLERSTLLTSTSELRSGLSAVALSLVIVVWIVGAIALARSRRFGGAGLAICAMALGLVALAGVAIASVQI
jgi:hypothetical protein